VKRARVDGESCELCGSSESDKFAKNIFENFGISGSAIHTSYVLFIEHSSEPRAIFTVCKRCRDATDDYELITKAEVQSRFLLPEGTIAVLRYSFDLYITFDFQYSLRAIK